MNHHISGVILDEGSTVVDVSRVAEQLNNDYTGTIVITVAPGGIFYTADLTKRLKSDISMNYISYPHTPGERNSSSTIICHQNIEIENRHIILIDDAIESDDTMKRLIKYTLDNLNPASLSIAVLFVKPRRVNILVGQYFACEMESDDLLVGYGMPWDNKYHNRPNVTKLVK